MDVAAQIATWLNLLANALGRYLLAPIGWLPGWLSATIVSAATGVLLLVIFKCTSNQQAIRRVRDDIKANLLALRLFKDSTSVTFRAQGRVFWGAFRLMLLAIVPMLVMVVPVCLLLGQLALWYQSRPLRMGEEAVITLKLGDSAESSWPDVRLEPTSAAEVDVGPVRVLSKREICWRVAGRENGYHRMRFQVDQQTSEKEIAIGDGFMRLSTKRPGWNWSNVLLHPWESPFRPDSAVESIEIDYPDRESYVSGTDWWVVYWFVTSMVAALCFRPFLNVNV
ncbi:MAG: hypothetical protein A2V70_16615 [Planctomycetes bacterium RBG_13_63_9]|nr:MAG: hypothetical protein A2V70_16615 [Planctomycetes bacterium RBG_13_63_9]